MNKDEAKEKYAVAEKATDSILARIAASPYSAAIVFVLVSVALIAAWKLFS